MLISVDESFNAETISNTDKIDDLAKQGTGIGIDFGLLFTPVKTMEPTFGLSITDIGGTSFKEIEGGDEATGKPASIVSLCKYWLQYEAYYDTDPISFSFGRSSQHKPKDSLFKKIPHGYGVGYRSVLKHKPV